MSVEPAPLSDTVGARQRIFRYGEAQWLSYDDAGRQFCIDTWVKWSTPMGMETVTVVLVPDALFPLNGHDKPYVVASVPIVQAGKDPFKLKRVVFIEIDTYAWSKMSELEKVDTRAKAREAGVGQECDRWYTKVGNVTLEEGNGRG